MLGTIVFVEEPRSKAEPGAEFPQKISACQESQALFQGMHVRASPLLDREKVGFLGLAVRAWE